MGQIQDIFQQAQLAEAAYANFINPDTGTIYSTDAGIEGALIAEKFSATQATEFAQHINGVGVNLQSFSEINWARRDIEQSEKWRTCHAA